MIGPVAPELKRVFLATVGQVFGPDDIRTRNLWAAFAAGLAQTETDGVLGMLAHANAQLRDARERNMQLCHDLRRLEDMTGKKA